MEAALYLIRHAQSHPTSDRHQSEWPLSPRGQRQAEALAGLLRPLGITRLFSSPFVRCLHTVRPFAGQAGIEIVVDEDLRERLIATTLVDDFPAVWSRSWDDFSFALPGCETSSSAQARFVAAVNRLWSTSEEGNLIAISTHGNVIGLLLNAIDPTAGRQEAEQLTNPDVVKIIRHDGRFSWDRAFCLAGLAEIATDHRDTPVDM